jgi:NADH-quinone oxidoreductase subunit G
LIAGERKAILLGNAAVQHPQAGSLQALAQWIAEQTGATLGFLGEAANTVGASLVRAQPATVGQHAGQMLTAGAMKAMVLLAVEPELDAANPAAARAALDACEMVVVMSSFKSGAASEYADVLLPIAPFSETSGTFVNAEGRAQSFHGVVKPLGETRPAWKVLRVLGNLLQVSGFDFDTSEQVKAAALGDLACMPARLSNRTAAAIEVPAVAGGLERVADVPIYCADALVRRSPALQATADARAPLVSLPASLWASLGLSAESSAQVKVSQGDASAVLTAVLDKALPDQVVRVAAGHPATSTLGAAFGPIQVDKV